MVLSGCCRTLFAVLRHVAPVLVLEQLGSVFFDTTLQMVVKERTANASYPDVSKENSQQKAMSDFFMKYYLIIQLVPIIPAMLLARLGDRGWRRVPIVVPLSGYLLSRLCLLLVVILRLPLELMYGGAALFGLSGGYCAFWPGVMTLASLASTATDRSKALMRVELLYGAAGLLGSLVSGHLFLLCSSTLEHGTILITVGTAMNLFALLHSIFLLQVKHAAVEEPNEDYEILSHSSSDAPTEAPARINLVNMALLFTAATLYTSAVSGAIDILGVFVMKEPLNWNATQVGYGTAVGCSIFLTSFVGVIVFRRCFSDVVLILIGMLSFTSGIYFMSFVTTTSMFYLARSLTLFALIPMPTIRSVLSQQVPETSCGITLTALQLCLKFAGLAYIPAYTKIYQRTLDWFPGFVFLLSSILTVLAMIPISIVGCRSPQRRHYERI